MRGAAWNILGKSPPFLVKNGAVHWKMLGKSRILSLKKMKNHWTIVRTDCSCKIIEMGDLAASHVRLPEGK